ncbi:MAG TPA: hypothetical protein VHS96_14330, partial [Bacteroidia bacterium]|nr:hypothetical protein [Bacteroidia bacterium]
IRPEVREMVPYHGASSFEMRHSSGSYVRFNAIWENQSEAGMDCADCCEKEFTESYYIYFQSEPIVLKADIHVSQTGVEGELEPTKFQIELDDAMYFADFTDGNCNPQKGLSCLDSMTVAGNVYTNVLVFQNQSTRNGAAATELFYDPSFGIIKFTEGDGTEFWELIR